MTVEREVLDRLDSLGIRFHVTGSWALSVHAEPRTTRDLDLVVDLDPLGYEHSLRPAFERGQPDAFPRPLRETDRQPAISVAGGVV